jgi:hypothetical protein
MMKNHLICLALSLTALAAFGQENPFSLGFQTNITRSEVVNDVFESLNGDKYLSGLGVSTGFTFTQKKRPRLSMQYGLFVSRLSESYNSPLRWPSEWDGENYVPDPSLPHSLRQNYSYFFLDAQVGLKAFFNDGRFRLFAMPYVEGNVFLLDLIATKLVYDDGRKEDSPSSSVKRQLRKFNASAGIAIGVEGRISRRLSLYAMPLGEYMLLGMGKHSTRGGRFLQLGGAVGVCYQ